jgi:hypothetical protein
VKVTNEFSAVEIDGKEPNPGDIAHLITVTSHWNRDKLVIVTIGGVAYTIIADELVKAVDNARNWRTW